MKNKSYSIIIVTDATSTNKEFVVSSKLIRNSILAFSVLMIILGFMIFDYLTISFDKEKMSKLETDNIQKTTIITRLSSEIKDINGRLVKIDDYTKRILVAIGLTSPNALKEVGTGGPAQVRNIGSDIELPNQVIDLKKDQPKNNLVDQVNSIGANAKQIEKSLKFVQDHINDQKIRMAHTPSLWPTRGYLTDTYGWRKNPITGKKQFHAGQDIATQLGNPVIATADGYILIAEYKGVLGNLIHIDHGFDYQTRYGHLSSFTVKEGDRVKRGQVIGNVGNTGRSTAPHLHYEVIYQGKQINPLHFILD
ncbi:MAG: M23 family metallopeptidase [Candidatus Aminicenantes bacterium]|nr:M23 family metallopeptidase [Candidatus Aminicenantes bacterium]